MSNRQIKEIRTDIGNSSVDYTGSNVSNQNVETDTMSLEIGDGSVIGNEIIDINKNSAFTSCLKNSIARNMNDAEDGVYLKVNEKYWLDRDFIFDEMKNGTYLISVIDANGTKVPMGYTSGDAYNKYVNHFSMENGDNGTYYVQTDVSGYNLKVYENGMICAYDADGILIKKINGNVVTSSTVGSGSQTKIYDDGSVVTVDSNGKIISISVNGENNVNLSSELEDSSNKTVSDENISNTSSEETVVTEEANKEEIVSKEEEKVVSEERKDNISAENVEEEQEIILSNNSSENNSNYTLGKENMVVYNSSTKTYMDYKKITSPSSRQYQYIQEHMTVCEDGFLRDSDGSIGVALGSFYGPIGSKYRITLDSGKVFDVVKIDEKSDAHTIDGIKHRIDGSVIEFVIDTDKFSKESNGYIHFGNFNNSDEWKGKIESIYQILDS